MRYLLEGTDPEHIGLLKEVLQVIFGLDDATIQKVVNNIKTSKNASKVKTNLVRTRIGARSMKYLRNAIEIARHEGIEKHEKDKDRDVEKDVDLEPEELKKEKDRKMKEKDRTNESFSFKDFLSEKEMTVTIDPTDTASTRKEINDAKRNPDRANRQQFIDAKKAKQQAQQEGDPIDTKIANLRMQLKQLELKKAQRDKAQEKEV